MPRKTKDVENEVIATTTKSTTKKSKTSSNSDVKKTSTSKKSVSKKADSKPASTKTTTKKKATSKASEKSPTTKKKTTTKKIADKKTTSAQTKKTTEKKSAAKSTTKKKTTPKTVKAKKATKEEILEYYDLPYRYNETVVKILAQTPKKLFIYWDISDDDRNNYTQRFGNDFFNNTIPVLIVHNNSMNYTFEVEINDFANCWYLDINDAKCDYTIELGRRSKIKSYYIPDNYIYVASSNKIESPNDHILFEKQSKTIYFRNVKNNNTHAKDIANLSFIERMGKVYNIYEAYKKMYGNEDFVNNPTSTFK